MRHVSLLHTLVRLCIVAVCFLSAASAQKYAVTLLALPGSTTSAGLSINNLGEVTGYSDTATSSGNVHAFLYNQGRTIDLNPYFRSTTSSGIGINDLGHVVATAGSTTSYIYRNGSATNLNLIGAAAINNLDQITGSSFGSASNDYYGWVYSFGRVTKIADLNGTEPADTHGINNLGEVVGEYRPLATPNPFYIPFTFWNGTATTLGDFPGSIGSVASAINDHGQVAGYSLGPVDHAYLYNNGTFSDLGTLAGDTTSAAYGINNSGAIVGSSGGARAFLYIGTTMIDLNTRIPANSRWTLTVAYGINESGQITGQGQFNGKAQGFLLTPLPSLSDVIQRVQSSDLPTCVTNSLIDRLKNAENNGSGAVSCAGLNEFAAEVRARTNSDLSQSLASDLLAMTSQVLEAESCH